MIDSGEVKDSNVSIMEKWNSNGYKEEGETKRDRDWEPESQIEPEELPQMWFCKCRLFF